MGEPAAYNPPKTQSGSETEHRRAPTPLLSLQISVLRSMENLLQTSNTSSSLTPSQATATTTSSSQSKNPPSLILRHREPSTSYWILLCINYLPCLWALSPPPCSPGTISFMAERAGGCLRGSNAPISSAIPPNLPLLSPPFNPSASAFSHFTPKLHILSICVNLFLCLNNFLISWEISYLSVSMSSLLLSRGSLALVHVKNVCLGGFSEASAHRV